MDAALDRLIEQIREAFSSVTREDGVTLHEAEVIDDYGSDQERKAARAIDTDEHWAQVSNALIERHYSILSFLDPKGWRYYLPAYMIWTLKHYQASASNSVDWTIYTLCPDDKSSLRKWAFGRYKILDAAQAAAVCQFLRFMSRQGRHADDRVARDALAKYWGRFCDEGG